MRTRKAQVARQLQLYKQQCRIITTTIAGTNSRNSEHNKGKSNMKHEKKSNKLSTTTTTLHYNCVYVCVCICVCNCNNAAMASCAVRQALIGNTLCSLYKYLVAIININYALEIYTPPYMHVRMDAFARS